MSDAAAQRSSFRDDAAYLADAADALVLRADGSGPVLVSPLLNQRVMTTAFADDQPGFGLVNREAIAHRAAGGSPRAFDNYGGEDRLWLAPEGGPWALFFRPGDAQDEAHWCVPAALDGRLPLAGRQGVAEDGASAWSARTLELDNVAGTRFRVEVQREIEALSRVQVEALLGPGLLLPELRVAAFRTRNRLGWAGPPPAGPGEIGLWTLGQFVPTDTTRALMPFRGPLTTRDRDPRAPLTRDLFARVPGDRLHLLPAVAPDATDRPTGVACFTVDGRLRGKLGVSRAGATGWLGAWDDERGVLTLVHHTLPAPDDLVPDGDWRPDNPHPGRGDVATSYNDGGEPRFFELESLSAALPRAFGAHVLHVSTTLHLGGEREALARVAAAQLGFALPGAGTALSPALRPAPSSRP